jgi:uncharacterized protein
MRFTLDTHPSANLVTGIGPQGIRVGQQWFARSLIVNAAELVTDWPVRDLDALDFDALAPALRLAPEIVILGTGARIRFPAPALFVALAERGIGLEVMDTPAACRTYNVLVTEDRPVVAALILP